MDTYNAKIECSELKKCGEIATSLSLEKSEFFLNCGFCDYTFLQLENFIRHMYEDHILEFSSVLKQEPIEEQELLNEEEGVLQFDETAEENRINNFMLKSFERVDIELDVTEVDTSPDIKENISQEFVIEEIEESNDTDSPKQISEARLLSEKALHKLNASRLKCDLNEAQTNKDEEPDEYEFLEEIDECKDDLETTHNKKHTHTNKCDLDKAQLIKNYDEYDEGSLGEEDDESSSQNDTQGNLKLAIKKGTSTPEGDLKDTQCIMLAELYKKYTCLWNEKDIAYRFRNRREEALKSLHKDFNDKSGLNLTQRDLEIEITLLRKSCSIDKKQKITCKRNKLGYQPTCPYYKNIAFLEVDVPPFECSECGKLLPGLGQYKVHLASHDGSLPFKCDLCGHGFQLASNLTVHLRRHVHDYTYRCEICDKPCATTTEIKIHMRSHTGEKPFVCSICGQKSRTSSHLLVHTLRHQKRPRHKCKLCPKMFYETGTLNEHMSGHRNIRDKICNVCNKGFTSLKQLRQHLLIHNAEKKYSCKLCGKRFAQFAGLSGHMKSHGTKLSANASESINFK